MVEGGQADYSRRSPTRKGKSWVRGTAGSLGRQAGSQGLESIGREPSWGSSEWSRSGDNRGLDQRGVLGRRERFEKFGRVKGSFLSDSWKTKGALVEIRSLKGNAAPEYAMSDGRKSGCWTSPPRGPTSALH